MKDLVILPGALGASSEFADFALLLANDFTVHLYDFPGHGSRIVESAEFSIPAFARDLENWLCAKGLKEVYLFGYSMGGYVALYLAHTCPERVAKVATLGTKLHWTPEIAAAETLKLNPEILKSKVPQFAQTLADRHGATTWPEIVTGTAQLMQSLGSCPLLAENVINELNCSVFFGIGDKDLMVTLEETNAAFKLVPKAQLCVFPDTKHQWDKAPMPLVALTLSRYFS